MSGHSKFANMKHKKEKNDAAKGKIFTIIGREIELDSELMIFVQPTRGLDIGAIENIHKQIIAERNAGKAILLISLELDEIMNCADTIGVIYNGEMQKIADAKELSTNQVGEFMMGVKHEKQ